MERTSAQTHRETNETPNSIVFPQANITAINAIADIFEPTLGPRAMDVLLLDAHADDASNGGAPPDYIVSGDGTRLLRALSVEHPVGELLERSIGPTRPGDTDIDGKDIFDGISSQIVFADALLTNSTELLENGLHPQQIIAGFRSGLSIADETLSASSISTAADTDVSAVDAARTALTGNNFGNIRTQVAHLAAEAATTVGMPNERTFDVTTIRHGSIRDSRLIDGVVLDRNIVVHQDMPRRIEDASVLLLGGHERGGLQDPDVVDSFTVDIESPETVGEFERQEAQKRRDVVDRIAETGANVVVTQMGINSHYQQLLAEHGIMAIRSVHPRNLRRLSLATGAMIVKGQQGIAAAHLGHCDTVVEEEIEQRKHRRKHRRMVVFDGCPAPNSVTMLLRGTFGQLESQTTREVRKATNAAAQSMSETSSLGGVVPGGGAIEMAIARAVRREAHTVGAKTQLAMNAFATALESVVQTLVRNAGEDPLETVTELRAANKRHSSTGFVLPDGEITDSLAAGVVDPAATKKNVYTSATDLAMLVLRVDDALDATLDEKSVDVGEAVYQDPAERHQEYIDETDSSTVWD
ncbi:thermosome [Halobellus sp. Atlit-38R]|uniref:TCP-1/cpn60 chaperonin family protein n=2 Tax=Haloferacaceae TaxID=1644056 RepID=UPI000EF2572E|nr:TCP-1/cpn60 chaperonin family protein [Halobellus sp. Atlit-38R]RLM87929.1 thermosome [Halobellus sp. Atlit-38R]